MPNIESTDPSASGIPQTTSIIPSNCQIIPNDKVLASPTVFKRFFDKAASAKDTPGVKEGSRRSLSSNRRSAKVSTPSSVESSSERLKSWKNRLQRRLVKSQDASKSGDSDGSILEDDDAGILWRSPLHQTLTNQHTSAPPEFQRSPPRIVQSGRLRRKKITTDESLDDTDNRLSSEDKLFLKSQPSALLKGRISSTEIPSKDQNLEHQAQDVPHSFRSNILRPSGSTDTINSTSTATYAELRSIAAKMKREKQALENPVYEDANNLVHFTAGEKSIQSTEGHPIVRPIAFRPVIPSSTAPSIKDSGSRNFPIHFSHDFHQNDLSEPLLHSHNRRRIHGPALSDDESTVGSLPLGRPLNGHQPNGVSFQSVSSGLKYSSDTEVYNERDNRDTGRMNRREPSRQPCNFSRQNPGNFYYSQRSSRGQRPMGGSSSDYDIPIPVVTASSSQVQPNGPAFFQWSSNQVENRSGHFPGGHQPNHQIIMHHQQQQILIKPQSLNGFPSSAHQSCHNSSNGAPPTYANSNHHQNQQRHQQLPSASDSGYSSQQNMIYNSSSQGSHGSPAAVGVHITPSPSDSGVAELESALKERETELNHLRQTMEQNEQVILRISQEKENKWQDKIQEWSFRLEDSIKTEHRLLTQIRELQDERSILQQQMDELISERQGLQKKCKELEQIYFDLKKRTEQESTVAVCKQCNSTVQIFPSANGTRLQENECPDGLRGEVNQLRGDVSVLKQSLQEQIQQFNDDRSRWNEEKQRVAQYQKMLQSNYMSIYRRNKSLEDRMMQLADQVVLNNNQSPKDKEQLNLKP